MQGFRVVFNSEKGRPTPLMRRFDRRAAAEAAAFHRGFGEYAPTPLTELGATAAAFGIGNILAKDESFRFGLNAFKVLGGSYCLGKLLSTRLGSETLLDAAELRRRTAGLPPQTFVTATDGNHGRGIAWAASYFGQRSVVYMPRGSAAERLENIRRAGAEAEITPLLYDDTVRHAKAQAAAEGWQLVQDTAWESYTEVPLLIMQGYLTIAAELHEQLAGRVPTHIFLQAGVGSMAAALAAALRDLLGAAPIASSAPQRRRMGSCTQPRASWIRSWRAWPAASRAPRPGSCWHPAPMPSWRWMMRRQRGRCGYWPPRRVRIRASSPAKAARPAAARSSRYCTIRSCAKCLASMPLPSPSASLPRALPISKITAASSGTARTGMSKK